MAFNLQNIIMAAHFLLNSDTEQHINNLFSSHIHRPNKVNFSIYQHHTRVIPPPHFVVNMHILKDAFEENTTVKMRKLWTKSQPGDIDAQILSWPPPCCTTKRSGVIWLFLIWLCFMWIHNAWLAISIMHAVSYYAMLVYLFVMLDWNLKQPKCLCLFWV